jgi:hypothetical protein
MVENLALSLAAVLVVGFVVPRAEIGGRTENENSVDLPKPVVNSPKVPEDVSIPPNFKDNPISFFDDYSWRAFIAVVWPGLKNHQGEPDPKQTVDGKGPRVFETYKSLAEVFHSDGTAPAKLNEYDIPEYNPCGVRTGYGDMTLGSFSKFSNLGQAGFGSLLGHQPLTKTRLVRFEQTKSAVPIFGSQVVVELGADRQLVSVDSEVARIKEVSPIASVTPEQALEKIAKLTGTKLDADTLGLEAPRLTFFHDDKKKVWHLAWFFQKVPAAPKRFLQESVGLKEKRHGLGRSPRELTPLLNYLIDVHNGKVLFYFSATPLLDVPTGCKGIDELGAPQVFYGRQVTDSFEMTDPFRGIKTYDLKGKDITATASFPKNTIRSKAADLRSANTGAVSAHVNATKVYDFYKSVLMRDSIDGKGMVLESVVNCTDQADEPPPE